MSCSWEGFGFVGPTICYALMQSVGMVQPAQRDSGTRSSSNPGELGLVQGNHLNYSSIPILFSYSFFHEMKYRRYYYCRYVGCRYFGILKKCVVYSMVNIWVMYWISRMKSTKGENWWCSIPRKQLWYHRMIKQSEDMALFDSLLCLQPSKFAFLYSRYIHRSESRWRFPKGGDSFLEPWQSKTNGSG